MGFGEVFRRIMRLWAGEEQEKTDVVVIDRRSEVVSMTVPYPEIPEE